MLVGIASVKGSPGVTTVALGLAAVWPRVATLLVEADPSGGDVAVWRRLGAGPSLASFAAAARRSGSEDGAVRLLAHAHDLGQDLYVVPGPPGAQRARAAVELLASRPGSLRSATGLTGAVGTAVVDTVIVDLGRLDPGSPARPLLGELDALLVLAPGSVTGLAHLAARAPLLPDDVHAGPYVGMLLTRRSRYRPREVEEGIGLPLLAVLPEDPASAAAMAGTATVRSRFGRTADRLGSRPLVVALRQLAERLEALPARSWQASSARPTTGTGGPDTSGDQPDDAGDAPFAHARRAVPLGRRPANLPARATEASRTGPPPAQPAGPGPAPTGATPVEPAAPEPAPSEPIPSEPIPSEPVPREPVAAAPASVPETSDHVSDHPADHPAERSSERPAARRGRHAAERPVDEPGETRVVTRDRTSSLRALSADAVKASQTVETKPERKAVPRTAAEAGWTRPPSS